MYCPAMTLCCGLARLGEISVSSDLCWQFKFRWCVSFSDISLKTKWYWCFPLIGSWWGDLCEDLQSWWWFQMIFSFHRHFCKDQIILVVPDDFFLSGRFVWRLGNTDGSRCFPFWELSGKSRYYCSVVVPFREISLNSRYYCSIVVPFREISLKTKEK